MLTKVRRRRINPVMAFRTFGTTLLMTALLSGVSPARMAAQAPRPQDPAALERVSAEHTRQRFRELMRDYPPTLAQVLRLDPTLMTNAAYLAPYPALAAYLAQHPELVHNPSYFLGDPGPFNDSHRQTTQAIQEAMAGLAFFIFFMTALAVAVHVGRSILEHRRWMHAMKIQTDTHTKLVDRLSSNEELMAYMQSPVGQRFLTSMPISVEPDSRAVAAPVARILTSIQIGIVAACGGTGLWIAKSRVIEEVAQPLAVIAVLAVALGIGFVVSAFISYGLSEQMGLMKRSSNA
jgi:hypothetical protein